VANKPNVLPTEFDTIPTFEQLAAQQGVRPVEDLASILGPCPGDEQPVDDFLTLLRAWRREGPNRNGE
jgi:hypothetical protein